MSVPPAPPAGPSDPDPVAAFRDFGLGKRVLRGVEALGFLTPTPIQREAIPAVQAGRDVLGLAKTGTGKTAAFALPLIDRLMTPGPGPRVLVVAPTRELATQIQEDFDRLGAFTRVRALAIFGGVPARTQVKLLRSRPPVLVATPGRLLDLLERGDVELDHLEVLVVDEADRLFDMGFLPDVRRILEAAPAGRQTLLFSATMPDEVRALVEDELRDPHRIELADDAPVETITHELLPVHSTRKADLLDHVLRAKDFRAGIVFCSSKEKTRRVAGQMRKRGHAVGALEGGMNQHQRDRALRRFRDGNDRVLVATDLAARGLDVARVSHVINVDVPHTAELYLHRIGRTGRAERAGRALTFAAHHEFAKVKAIEKELGVHIPRRKLKEFQVPDHNAKPGAKSGAKTKSGGRTYAKGFGGNRPGGGRKPKASRGVRRRRS